MDENKTKKVKFQTNDYDNSLGLLCSHCGCAMLNDIECGWFDSKENKNGDILVKPNFKFCPYCGRPVYQGWIKEVKED